MNIFTYSLIVFFLIRDDFYIFCFTFNILAGEFPVLLQTVLSVLT